MYSLAIRDFSEERAKAIQLLQEYGIPIIANLMMPEELGYWINMDNIAFAHTRYKQFSEWESKYNLDFFAIGLDINFHLQDVKDLAAGRFEQLYKKVATRFYNMTGYLRAREYLKELTTRIHRDGYSVQSYLIPVVYDERECRSTKFQRASGTLWHLFFC